MKGKQLILLLVLLIISCKITEKNIGGGYEAKHYEAVINLRVWPDHRFAYSTFYTLNNTENKLQPDSIQLSAGLYAFTVRGRWKLDKNELTLNSAENDDIEVTVSDIKKQRINLKESIFEFKDADGKTILLDGVCNGKYDGSITCTEVNDSPIQSIDIEAAKNDTLHFSLFHYYKKGFTFIKKDSASYKYLITFKATGNKANFKDQAFSVSRNSIKNDTVKFKRVPNR